MTQEEIKQETEFIRDLIKDKSKKELKDIIVRFHIQAVKMNRRTQ